MEFEVVYDCLQPLYKVGKYYLNKLIVLGSLDENNRPSFACQIKDPVGFLEELISRFIASSDAREHEIILMALCILYRRQCDEIGPLKSLPFWLKLISLQEYTNCHFLML